MAEIKLNKQIKPSATSSESDDSQEYTLGGIAKDLGETFTGDITTAVESLQTFLNSDPSSGDESFYKLLGYRNLNEINPVKEQDKLLKFMDGALETVFKRIQTYLGEIFGIQASGETMSLGGILSSLGVDIKADSIEGTLLAVADSLLGGVIGKLADLIPLGNILLGLLGGKKLDKQIGEGASRANKYINDAGGFVASVLEERTKPDAEGNLVNKVDGDIYNFGKSFTLTTGTLASIESAVVNVASQVNLTNAREYSLVADLTKINSRHFSATSDDSVFIRGDTSYLSAAKGVKFSGAEVLSVAGQSTTYGDNVHTQAGQLSLKSILGQLGDLEGEDLAKAIPKIISSSIGLNVDFSGIGKFGAAAGAYAYDAPFILFNSGLGAAAATMLARPKQFKPIDGQTGNPDSVDSGERVAPAVEIDGSPHTSGVPPSSSDIQSFTQMLSDILNSNSIKP